MNSAEVKLLAKLERRLDNNAEEVAIAVAKEAEAFGPIRDPGLSDELRELARFFWLAFIETARRSRQPRSDQLQPVRHRAAQRAREMVPLHALVHAYVVGMRTMVNRITTEAGPDISSQRAALSLISHLAEFQVVTMSTMVEAYQETVQGERANRDADRIALIDELLVLTNDASPELIRRAAGLGIGTERSQVVALANVRAPENPELETLGRRWAAEHIARATGKTASRAFVVVRGKQVVTVLDSSGETAARVIVDRARGPLLKRHGVALVVGIGTAFTGIRDFSRSFRQADRALRHTNNGRRIVCAPDDISLFEEIASNSDANTLIPEKTRLALEDKTLLSTLEALLDANLSVAKASKQLILHENSVRYRLEKIARMTGRDPRNIHDLMELVAAARIMAAASGDSISP
jgi:sugar diacid utilization regulator